MKKIPVPKATVDIITRVVTQGLMASDHIPSVTESEAIYLQTVQKEIQALNLDESMQFAVSARGSMALDALFEHKEKLIKLGAVNEGSQGLGVSHAFFYAISTVPLKISITDDGGAMRFHYETLRFINLSKRKVNSDGYAGSEYQFSEARRSHFSESSSLRRAAQEFDSVGGMGELFKGEAPDLAYELEDWPRYESTLRARRSAIALLPEDDRDVYSQSERSETDPLYIRLCYMLDVMPPELLEPAGIGPWDRYYSMEEDPGFDYGRYIQVVTKSPSHATTPDLRGDMPIHIVARCGSAEKMERCWQIVPESVNFISLEGRHIVFDIIQHYDREDVLDVVMAFAPDLSRKVGGGICCLRAALETRNWHAVGALLHGGFDLGSSSLDQRAVDFALQDETCPPDLRTMLTILSEDLPEVSEFSRSMSGMEKIISDLDGGNP